MGRTPLDIIWQNFKAWCQSCCKCPGSQVDEENLNQANKKQSKPAVYLKNNLKKSNSDNHFRLSNLLHGESGAEFPAQKCYLSEFTVPQLEALNKNLNLIFDNSGNQN